MWFPHPTPIPFPEITGLPCALSAAGGPGVGQGVEGQQGAGSPGYKSVGYINLSEAPI